MGSHLAKPIQKKTSHNQKGKYLNCGASLMQGWRTTMEDAHIFEIDFEPNCSLFGILDGHGGPDVAKFVSVHFPLILKKQELFKQKRNLELALKEAFLQMDSFMQTKEGRKLILQQKKGYVDGQEDLNDDGIFADEGCTANIVLIYKNEIYVANCGDSRSVICNNNIAYLMSEDHKPTQQSEKSRIEKAGGYITFEGRVNGNLNLSRSFGDFKYKMDEALTQEEQVIVAVPDVRKKIITQKDQFLIVCCDGVWEVQDSQYVIDFCREQQQKNPSSNPSTYLEQLFDKLIAPDTKQGKGCDNMSGIIVFFNHNELQKIK